MPRIFNRIISFRVEGEVYDTETKPEDILKNYTWNFRDHDGNHKVFLVADHMHDHRGTITNIVPFGKVKKCTKPDTEYFII